MATELEQDIKQRLVQVRGELATAARAANRPVEDIDLLAVSKGQPAEAIRALCALGVTSFAENYLAEALTKQSKLRDLPLSWHFIGQTQSNKTPDISAYFDWVQSLDRLKIARRLDEQRPDHLPPLNVCVQINIGREEQKGGILAEDALPFCMELKKFSRLRLRGFMAIPRARARPAELQENFEVLTRLLGHVNTSLKSEDFNVLSLGMSADFPVAIAAGSTMVRIGTALFGPRSED